MPKGDPLVSATYLTRHTACDQHQDSGSNSLRIRLRFLTARRSTFPGVGRLAADCPGFFRLFTIGIQTYLTAHRPPATRCALGALTAAAAAPAARARRAWGGSGFIVESLGGPRYGNAFAGGSAGNTSGASSALASKPPLYKCTASPLETPLKTCTLSGPSAADAPMPLTPPAGLHACNSPTVGYADFCATWPPQSDADKVPPGTVTSIRKAVQTHLAHFPSGV